MEESLSVPRQAEPRMRLEWTRVAGLKRSRVFASHPTIDPLTVGNQLCMELPMAVQGIDSACGTANQGERFMTLFLPNTTITNVDWESMAIGSCGNFDGTCIYIADVGDNTARTSSGRRSRRKNLGIDYRLVKVQEPNWEDYEDGDELPLSSISVLPFDYMHPSSPVSYFDCESTFLDHTGWGDGNAVGDYYVVTKMKRGADALNLTRVFKIPVNAWPQSGGVVGAVYSPEAVGTYVKGSDFFNKTYRSGSMTRDGTVIALGDKEQTYLFLRCPGESVADVLAPSGGARSCYTWLSPTRGQVETFAWTPDGMRSFQIPEGNGKPIGVTEINYNVESTGQVCPMVHYDESGNCISQEDCSVVPNAWCDVGADFYSDPSILVPRACGSTVDQAPTDSPTSSPVAALSAAPTASDIVTSSPTEAPTTSAPVIAPTTAPTVEAPTVMSDPKTSDPVADPTASETNAGSTAPTEPNTRAATSTSLASCRASLSFAVIYIAMFACIAVHACH